MFYVYVLRSDSDAGFYIGFSTNLRVRLRQHQNGESFSTKSRGPWKLIYYEAYTEREDAEGREKFLKSGAGRRLLRAQLRHYLRVKGFASRGCRTKRRTNVLCVRVAIGERLWLLHRFLDGFEEAAGGTYPGALHSLPNREAHGSSSIMKPTRSAKKPKAARNS